MIFNLIPLYPLDGGRILVSLFSMKNNNKYKIMKIMKIASLVLGIIFLILFIVSLFYFVNYNLLIIGCFLILNHISSDRNRYYDKVFSFNKKNNEPIEIKCFKMDKYDKITMLKCLSPHYYSVFEIDGKIKKIRIEEKELIE
jgi:stage IV sporulation protein FB